MGGSSFLVLHTYLWCSFQPWTQCSNFPSRYYFVLQREHFLFPGNPVFYFSLLIFHNYNCRCQWFYLCAPKPAELFKDIAVDSLWPFFFFFLTINYLLGYLTSFDFVQFYLHDWEWGWRVEISHWQSHSIMFKSKRVLPWNLSELEHKYKCSGSASVYLNSKFFGVIFFGKCFQAIWQQNDSVNCNVCLS